ncbi:hypothetical protein TNCV_4231211 [Trichonephila clavipes]|uniref:Uncharacterized protein n=1 Tax=Trichonephila clavipes TaxID=2585209 RepID=A0A8X6SMA5_TRICX|nr:hypothetical protein TNCV_4231211 [Trichonephila clavipes]
MLQSMGMLMGIIYHVSTILNNRNVNCDDNTGFTVGRIRWPPLACKFKASLPSSSGRRAGFLGGQKGVASQLQDARVGVGSTKKPTPLDVDVRRSDVTRLSNESICFGYEELLQIYGG